MLQESDLGRSPRPVPPFTTLTPAERLVAAHVVEGLSSKEIAAVLGRAEATIKHQISSILSKTGIPTRARFIARYYQQFFCVLAPADLPAADKTPSPAPPLAGLRSQDRRRAPPGRGATLAERPACGATPLVRSSFSVLCQTAAG
jgi:DNA-binding CsgD family transcriptional regulator